MTVDAAQDDRLREAGDRWLALWREHEPGDCCPFCDNGYGPGEVVDALFCGAHLICVEDNVRGASEVDDETE